MSNFATELPAGYRWANYYECEVASKSGDFSGMIQIRRGGTDDEPMTDLAVPMSIRCPVCGATLEVLLEYSGNYYSEHRDFAGFACDNYKCDARWDINGDSVKQSALITNP